MRVVDAHAEAPQEGVPEQSLVRTRDIRRAVARAPAQRDAKIEGVDVEGADAHELLVSILHNQHLLNQNIVKAGLLLTGSTDQIDFKNDEIMVELEAHAEDGGGCCCVLL